MSLNKNINILQQLVQKHVSRADVEVLQPWVTDASTLLENMQNVLLFYVNVMECGHKRDREWDKTPQASVDNLSIWIVLHIVFMHLRFWGKTCFLCIHTQFVNYRTVCHLKQHLYITRKKTCIEISSSHNRRHHWLTATVGLKAPWKAFHLIQSQWKSRTLAALCPARTSFVSPSFFSPFFLFAPVGFVLLSDGW